MFLYYAGAALSLLEPKTDAAGACAVFGVPLLVAWWAEHDSRRRRYWPAFHYGLLLIVFAPFLAPHYVLHTRGRKGLGLALALLVAMLAPFLGWWLGSLLWPVVWLSAPAA